MIRNINVFVIVLHVCFNSADSGNPFRNQIDRSINALMLLISSVCATGFLISALVGNLLVKTRKVSRQSSMILGMENS
jgi:hypothetical protein